MLIAECRCLAENQPIWNICKLCQPNPLYTSIDNRGVKLVGLVELDTNFILEPTTARLRKQVRHPRPTTYINCFSTIRWLVSNFLAVKRVGIWVLFSNFIIKIIGPSGPGQHIKLVGRVKPWKFPSCLAWSGTQHKMLGHATKSTKI